MEKVQSSTKQKKKSKNIISSPLKQKKLSFSLVIHTENLSKLKTLNCSELRKLRLRNYFDISSQFEFSPKCFPKAHFKVKRDS